MISIQDVLVFSYNLTVLLQAKPLSHWCGGLSAIQKWLQEPMPFNHHTFLNQIHIYHHHIYIYIHMCIYIYIIHISLLSRSCLADGFKPPKRHYYLAMGIIISFLWSNINEWLKRPTVFPVISSQTQTWLIIIPKCKGVFRVASNTPNTIGFDFTLTLKNTVVTNQSNIAMIGLEQLFVADSSWSGWWFQPLWKIWVNGKDYPIYYNDPKSHWFLFSFCFFFPAAGAWRQQLDEVLTDLHQLTGLFKGTNPGQQVLHLPWGSPWWMGKPSKYRDFTGENGDFTQKIGILPSHATIQLDWIPSNIAENSASFPFWTNGFGTFWYTIGHPLPCFSTGVGPGPSIDQLNNGIRTATAGCWIVSCPESGSWN